jgi:diguanylate cyclase (GGDEF)-like protein
MFDESYAVKSFLDAIPFGVYVVEKSTMQVVFMNRALCEQLGDQSGKTCYEAIYQEGARCAHCTLERVFDSEGRIRLGQPDVFELFNPVDDHWYQMQHKAMAWPDGRLVLYSIAVDISELKETQNRLAEAHAQLALNNRELRTVAITDRLTRVYNRVKLDEVLEHEVARAERYGSTFSAILIDLDHFKSVNDTYGHAAGDEALRSTAGTIVRNVRKTDIVGRWGGEEFLVLAPETGLVGAIAMAEKLQYAIAEHDHGRLGRRTASLGVAAWHQGETCFDMLARADAALYRAKRLGRNRVVSADSVSEEERLLAAQQRYSERSKNAGPNGNGGIG